MSDLFKGRTMTEAFKLVSGGAAYTLQFNFQPDKVVVNNLTHWTATAGKLPLSTWFRDETTAAHAYQQQVIDSAAAQSFNFLDLATNGFTVADTSGGQTSAHKTISGVSKADPCVVTTSAVHGFQDNQIVRITDLGNVGPNATARGMNEINNERYKIVVLSTTTFSLKDPVTGEAINSSSYTTYVAGGFVALESHVITLNNPESAAYTANPFAYDPVDYKLTLGTSIMGSDSDVIYVEAHKFGLVTDLGDIG